MKTKDAEKNTRRQKKKRNKRKHDHKHGWNENIKDDEYTIKRKA